MVYIDSAQYRPEAIVYAKAEIDRRGIPFSDIHSISDSTPADTNKPAALGYKLLTALRHRAFAVGFLTALLFFVVANAYSYIEMPNEPGIDDGFEGCGFPFKVYMYGGFAGMDYILWEGLVADVLIATVAGISMGLTCKSLFGIRGKRPAV